MIGDHVPVTPRVARRQERGPASLRAEVDKQHPRSRDLRALMDGLWPLVGDDVESFYPHKHQWGARFGRGVTMDSWRKALSAVWRLTRSGRRLHPALQELVDAVVDLDIEEQGFEFKWDEEFGPYLYVQQKQEVWERLRAAYLRLEPDE